MSFKVGHSQKNSVKASALEKLLQTIVIIHDKNPPRSSDCDSKKPVAAQKPRAGERTTKLWHSHMRDRPENDRKLLKAPPSTRMSFQLEQCSWYDSAYTESRRMQSLHNMLCRDSFKACTIWRKGKQKIWESCLLRWGSHWGDVCRWLPNTWSSSSSSAQIFWLILIPSFFCMLLSV